MKHATSKIQSFQHIFVMLLHYLRMSKCSNLCYKYNKRYNLKIILYAIKIRHYMSYGYTDINTVTPVAHVSIICLYI